jgi:hypothetical protein
VAAFDGQRKHLGVDAVGLLAVIADAKLSSAGRVNGRTD